MEIPQQQVQQQQQQQQHSTQQIYAQPNQQQQQQQYRQQQPQQSQIQQQQQQTQISSQFPQSTNVSQNPSRQQNQLQQPLQPIQQQQQQQIPSPNWLGNYNLKMEIKLKEDLNNYIIELSCQQFPSQADYRPLLTNRKIFHQLIPDMHFEFLDKALRITFGKLSLKEINPYRVLSNIYNKINGHYLLHQQSRDDLIKNFDTYPQVTYFLMTPISYELVFQFCSYKYQDNKNKEEQLRISNILGFDIYQEIRNNLDGSYLSYHIQQVKPEVEQDRYGSFQSIFKSNLFCGQVVLLRIDQILQAIENHYVPLFIVQKMFFQIDDYFQPQYSLPTSDVRALHMLTDSISSFPSTSCILFVPHNSLKRQRLNANRSISEKIDSRAVMVIRFETCLGCRKFEQEVQQKQKEFKINFKEKYKEELLRQEDTTLQHQIEQIYQEQTHALQKQLKAIKPPIAHEYYLRISFGELFQYMHTEAVNQQMQSQQQSADSSDLPQLQSHPSWNNPQTSSQTYQFRSFEVFSYVVQKMNQEKGKINSEKQQITIQYTGQSELELTLFSLLSLLFQMHFLFYYYYYFCQIKLPSQKQAEIKFEKVPLVKDAIVLRLSVPHLPYQVALKVDSASGSGLILFGLKIIEPEIQLQLQSQPHISPILLNLQSWLLSTITMNPFLKQEAACAFLQKGNKLIQSLQNNENKANKIFGFFKDLCMRQPFPQNFDLTVFGEEDKDMKKYYTDSIYQQVAYLQKQLELQLPQLTPQEQKEKKEIIKNKQQQYYQKLNSIESEKYKKLFEINYDIDRKNRLVIYLDGSYSLFTYIMNNPPQEVLLKLQLDPRKNVFTDPSDQIGKFLQEHFVHY